MQKNKSIPKKPKFKVGEEVICIINGERAYIITFFKACIVNFGKKLRVIPEESLCLESFREILSEGGFVQGDTVRIIPTEKTVVTGTVVDSKRFYVIHQLKDGQIKVALPEVLVKGNKKIIPFMPVNPLNIKLKDLPGQSKLFNRHGNMR